jgi:hypothetical protein
VGEEGIVFTPVHKGPRKGRGKSFHPCIKEDHRRKKKEYSPLDNRRSCGGRRRSVRFCIIENMYRKRKDYSPLYYRDHVEEEGRVLSLHNRTA